MIPGTADEIELARPADINDLSAGWEPLEPKGEKDDAADGGKGKAKAASSSKTKSKDAAGKNTLKDCPKGAGLRDGGIVAFKFREKDEDEDEWEKVEGGDDAEIVVKEKEERWDVVVPSVEETYGEGHEGVDEGVEDVR